jgi:hypothetical protein
LAKYDAAEGRTDLSRYVAGYNLGLVVRLLVGARIPREFLARASAYLLAFATADGAALVMLVLVTGTGGRVGAARPSCRPREAKGCVSSRDPARRPTIAGEWLRGWKYFLPWLVQYSEEIFHLRLEAINP